MAIQNCFIYIPIISSLTKRVPNTTGITKTKIQGTIWIASLLVTLLLIAIMDTIFTIFLNMSYSVFYYLAWLDVLLASGIAMKVFIFGDWSDLQENLKRDSHSNETATKLPILSGQLLKANVMLVECPHCHNDFQIDKVEY